MRDTSRMDEVLTALRNAWAESPELRLGQLIVNAIRPSDPCPEIFYIEDDGLLKRLNGYREQVLAAGSRTDPGAS